MNEKLHPSSISFWTETIGRAAEIVGLEPSSPKPPNYREGPIAFEVNGLKVTVHTDKSVQIEGVGSYRFNLQEVETIGQESLVQLFALVLESSKEKT